MYCNGIFLFNLSYMCFFIIIFRLQKENENLVGKYAVHSQVLQNEVIDLPVTVEVRYFSKYICN